MKGWFALIMHTITSSAFAAAVPTQPQFYITAYKQSSIMKFGRYHRQRWRERGRWIQTGYKTIFIRQVYLQSRKRYKRHTIDSTDMQKQQYLQRHRLTAGHDMWSCMPAVATRCHHAAAVHQVCQRAVQGVHGTCDACHVPSLVIDSSNW